MAIQDKFNKPNHIYKITKDIDLEGQTLTIPNGCTLDFQGGSFRNGIITLDNTAIIASPTSHIFKSVDIQGTFGGDNFHVGWIGALTTNADNTDAIKKAIILSGTLLMPIVFSRGNYIVSRPIVIDTLLNNVLIKGNKATITKSTNTTSGITESKSTYGGNVSIDLASILIVSEGHYWTIRDLSFIGGSKNRMLNYGITIVKGSNWYINNCIFDYCSIGLVSYGLWMSNITKVSCNDVYIGFIFDSNRLNDKTGTTGTSICFNNCYVNRCNTGFLIDWLNYSTLNCCAVDHATTVSYRFTEGTTVVMNGCGTEQSKAWINALNSKVTLNNCQLLSSTSNNTSTIVALDNSNIIFINCYFQDQETKAIFSNTNSNISLINSEVTVNDTNFVFSNNTTGVYSIKNENILTTLTYNGNRVENIFDLRSKSTGVTASRPNNVPSGFQYFDTTINKPIYWTGTKWVDATGADV